MENLQKKKLKIIHGKGFATKYKFPTANVKTTYPEDSGIFIGTVFLHGTKYEALIYTSIYDLYTTECYIYNFDGDLYGKYISYNKLHKLRPDIQYSTLDDTIFHIHLDMIVGELCFLILRGMFENKTVSLNFTGSIDSSILAHLLDMMDITYDKIHIKPENAHIDNYVSRHECRVFTDSNEATNYIDINYNVIFSENIDIIFKLCQLQTPLLKILYKTKWDIIEHLGIHVNEKYSLGYSSIGYASEKNNLLKISGTEIYKHAKFLKNLL